MYSHVVGASSHLAAVLVHLHAGGKKATLLQLYFFSQAHAVGQGASSERPKLYFAKTRDTHALIPWAWPDIF
jgi:hypothetical protein